MRIYIGGTFDLPHGGHVELFRNAAQYGDVVAVLNTDDFAERYKRRPIMTLDERLAVIEAIKWVKYVDVNIGCEDSSISIRHWSPNYIGHGDDWQGDSLLEQLGITEKFLQDMQIKMVVLPYTSGISSSEIERRICNRLSAEVLGIETAR